MQKRRWGGEESLGRTSEVSRSGQMCSLLLQLPGSAETSRCKKGLPLRRGRRQEIHHLRYFIPAHKWWTELSPSRPVEALVHGCLRENEKSCWWNANNASRVQTLLSKGQKKERQHLENQITHFPREPLNLKWVPSPWKCQLPFRFLFCLYAKGRAGHIQRWQKW